jgi:hypothetical protein
MFSAALPFFNISVFLEVPICRRSAVLTLLQQFRKLLNEVACPSRCRYMYAHCVTSHSERQTTSGCTLGSN